MVDLDVWWRRLERASFVDRERIAQEAARALGAERVGALAAGLDHPLQPVRLGVIEVLRHAGLRDSLPRLLRHARERDGDDRVFALRALTHLARPGDPIPDELLRAFIASGDPFVEIQARALLRALAPAEESIASLVKRLHLAAAGERVELVAAIERRGRDALAAATRVLAPKASGDVVALLCRALLRHGVPEAATLVPLLDAARRRLAGWPVACAAIDDLLVAAGDGAATAALLARAGDLDEAQLAALVRRLLERPAAELLAHAPALIAAAQRRAGLWAVLAHVAAAARESVRTELRAACDAPLAELRRGKSLEPAVALALGRVLAEVSAPGEPLSRPLAHALERHGGPEAPRVLAAWYARLGTEEAARALLALPGGAAPAAWRSPWVQLGDGGEITARYEDPQGRPLARRDDRLVDDAGEEHVLDPRGQPVRAADTEHGGCRCCAPPRALVRRRIDGLFCPSTGVAYVKDGARVLLERDAPLGRCRRCDSVRARVREGVNAVCLDCGAGRPGVRVEEGASPPPVAATIPSEHGARAGEDTLPKPPRPEEVAGLAPHIRAALLANVFLEARLDGDRWSGSGIIVARDDDRVAILTNRHVVEGAEDERLCIVRALAVTGEVIATTTLWRARRGVDLALLEGKVARPDEIGVIPLGTGAAAVGAPAFAMGNPLGLAWSYSAGTVSAIRSWVTSGGLPVQILQTDVTTAPGSSGGGLFHGDGHLLGVISFGRWGGGGSAHFALSVQAIREALAREKVRWRGRALDG